LGGILRDFSIKLRELEEESNPDEKSRGTGKRFQEKKRVETKPH